MHRGMSSYETSRHVPIRYETDFWNRPNRWGDMAPAPFNMQPMQGFSSSPTFSSPPPFPTSLPPPPPPMQPDFGGSSSLVHYPSRERQYDTFQQEMSRMNNEMGKMFQNMQTLTPAKPVGSVDDWRLSENFRLENPIITDNDGSRKFKLQFDVRQFKPEEIQVKTAGNTLSVQAKHEEKDPSKAMFREYNRSYVIPKDVNAERLTSKLSTDGILIIEAPLPAIEGPREKLIAIKHT